MHSSFFVTTATLAQVTDATNIGLVFAAVKETILWNALKDSEILSAARLMGRILCCLVSSFHISFERSVSDVRSLLSLHRSSIKKIPACRKSIEIVVTIRVSSRF
jgi:exopolysaccharide biosynthesis predicted pyruvyltransferase EpsI